MAAVAQKQARPVADAASQDVRKVAAAVGDNTKKAAADVSDTLEGVAKDVEVLAPPPPVILPPSNWFCVSSPADLPPHQLFVVKFRRFYKVWQ